MLTDMAPTTTTTTTSTTTVTSVNAARDNDEGGDSGGVDAGMISGVVVGLVVVVLVMAVVLIVVLRLQTQDSSLWGHFMVNAVLRVLFVDKIHAFAVKHVCATGKRRPTPKKTIIRQLIFLKLVKT